MMRRHASLVVAIVLSLVASSAYSQSTQTASPSPKAPPKKTTPAQKAKPAAQTPPQESAPTPYEPHSGQAGKDVVWVPTPQGTVDKMLDMAGLTERDYLIDLGSGDGITVITAAKKGATALGVEFNPDMVALAEQRAKEAGVAAKARFVKGDLFEADLSKATVITLFLLPDINVKLRPKLLELKPGTRVVSNTFGMGDWQPDMQETRESCTSWCSVLMWVVPAKVAGTWRLGSQELTLTQQYQVLSGTLGKTPISDGKVNGEQITFTAGGRTYTGHVEGNMLVGGDWAATRLAQPASSQRAGSPVPKPLP